MRIDPHLNFNGECEAACKFYEQCLGGKITFSMTYAGSPMANQVPAAWGNKILHLSLAVGENIISAADAPPDRYQKPQGFHVAIDTKDPAEAEGVFHALAKNGTVQMPVQETFWALRFGMLIDQYGIPWMVNCSKPM